MKTLLVCLMIVLFPIFAWANPFLVSDPQSVVDSYGIILDGEPQIIVPAESLGLGIGRLCYDLQGIQPGPHSVEVWACNVMGCSEHVFFDFTWDPANPPDPERLPDSPMNLRVILE